MKNKNWRFIYMLIRNAYKFPYALGKMKKGTQKYSENPCKEQEEANYDFIKNHLIKHMTRTSHVKTIGYGMENLPKEGGYMMYPNHEGKWDMYGLISVHERPCSFIMDIEMSNMLLIKEIVDLLRGKRLSKTDNRQAVKIINEVTKEVEEGRIFVLFPEGEYTHEKKNTLFEFKSGCFKASIKSKTPIVPVALWDSYKVYNGKEIGRLTTEVHFLKPIMYDEYKDLNTHQVAELVKSRIQEKLDELEASKKKSK